MSIPGKIFKIAFIAGIVGKREFCYNMDGIYDPEDSVSVKGKY